MKKICPKCRNEYEDTHNELVYCVCGGKLTYENVMEDMFGDIFGKDFGDNK